MTSQNPSYVDARYSVYNNPRRDLNITQINSLDQILQRLEPALMDASTRTECLSGTRTDILQCIIDWVYDSSVKQRVLWLYGLAGSGKSTVATTIANALQERGSLGAFLFFNRNIEESSQPANVIRTLAYQLALFNPIIGTTIAKAIETTPRIAQSILRLQFDNLLVKPLSALPPINIPIVLVLDGLDECGSAEDRKALIALIAQQSIRLPSFVRLLLTSRAESDIRRVLEGQSHVLIWELDLASTSNIQDITSFFQERMENIRLKNEALSLANDWPGDDAIFALTEHAAGLFVWASTACHFIDGHDPRRNLDAVLRGDVNIRSEAALDVLYRTALESSVAGAWDDEYFRADFCSIMGMVVVARNPVCDTTIDTLLSLDRPSRHTISRFGCLLHWSATTPVRILHPSFLDFITNRTRCGPGAWYIDASFHNRTLAFSCMLYMDGVLKRNFCNLTLTLAPVNEELSGAITYACTSWVDHILAIIENAELVEDMLEQFLFRHLLHWVETMSILKKSRTAITLVHGLLEWLRMNLPHRTKLFKLVGEASRFMQTFATTIEEHPLLIYLTALPAIPVNTLLYKTFAGHDTPCIVGGFNKSWPLLLHMLQGHSDEVTSVVFFPDGSRIVSSSRDGTIRVWDVTMGVEVLAPLVLHGGIINSSAISPSGIHVASGLDDHTIRLCDIINGQEVQSPLQGHTDEVLSVAFSPDGARIASGSADCTVRIWNTNSGSATLAPMLGHNDRISTVSFTPDGKQIISGSWDKTIRMWDVVRGTQMLHPLEHKGAIYSVAASADGHLIASSSADGPIHVWDATTGARSQVLEADDAVCLVSVTFFPNGRRIAANTSYTSRPKIYVWDIISGARVYESTVQYQIACTTLSPNGEQFGIGCFDGTVVLWDTTLLHQDSVKLRSPEGNIVAIAFSANGQQIASCSDQDLNICIWEAQSGMKTMAPLEGHEKQITSLAFSPDSKLIVSASVDTTIRVWDAIMGAEVLVLQGHSHAVLCVAFSSDGMQIVSGSRDRTVRLWDVRSGTQATPPLVGHEDAIQGVAISPDRTRVISGSVTGCVRMWDVASSMETFCFTIAHGPDYPTSVAFSPDGRYILTKFWKDMRVWDTSEACFIPTTNYLHDRCTCKDAIIITPNAWIVDIATQKILSKLPSIVSVCAYTASQTSIAFTIQEMKSIIFIVQFPPTVLTVYGTWDPAAYKFQK